MVDRRHMRAYLLYQNGIVARCGLASLETTLGLESLGLDDIDYKGYLVSYPIHELLGIDISSIDPSHKAVYPPTFGVDPTLTTPFPAELDDLIRLHHLVVSRKVTTILEFGIGKSTLVLADALSINKRLHNEYVATQLRRGNPFEIHSVDNYEKWISKVRDSVPPSLAAEGNMHFHCCPVSVGDFNDRLCTYYEGLPDLCPDFIYLDGPDQFSTTGSLRGLSTRHQDRMPMAADILSFEHFLCPGTLIVVDGRTANARFLKCNLQRRWSYLYHAGLDQHFFELREEPLGIYNKRQIDYCLGPSYYSRLQEKG
jgi:hypothetical protein